MKLRVLFQLLSARDLRNAALATLVVLGGLGLSGLTLYAHRAGDLRLAGISAGLSLIFVLLILVFIIPPLARNASREASQLNLPFEFTTGGAIMIVLILIVGFSAWNSGNNLLFLVLSFLIASMITGFLAGSICLKKLDVTMRFPEAIFAGEKTPVLVSIKNRKRLIPAISVVVDVRGKERERSVVAEEIDALLPKWIAKRMTQAPVVRRTLGHFVRVAAGETLDLKREHIFPHRGRFLIKDFAISTHFPFGFFTHRRRLAAREAELIVFPRPAENVPDISRSAADVGSRPYSRRGTGQDLMALRDYQPHDDLRHIDWKASARTRVLTVREYAAEEERRVTLIFDTRLQREDTSVRSIREKLEAEHRGAETARSERFESGVSIAAAILHRLTLEQAQFRLIIRDDVGEQGTGRGHLYASLKRLAVAEPLFVNGTENGEPLAVLERIPLHSEAGHSVLLTAFGSQSSDDTQKLIILGF